MKSAKYTAWHFYDTLSWLTSPGKAETLLTFPDNSLTYILHTYMKSSMINPIHVLGGLIAPAVWKTSSSGVSFHFCDLKTWTLDFGL